MGQRLCIFGRLDEKAKLQREYYVLLFCDFATLYQLVWSGARHLAATNIARISYFL